MVSSGNLHMGHTTKCAQEVHSQFRTIPDFIGHPALHAPRQRPVQDEDGGAHCLTAEPIRDIRPHHHAAGHPQHSLVVPLHHAVLLRHVWRGEVTLNSMIGAVGGEGLRRELAAVIGTQHAELLSGFHLQMRLQLGDRRRGLILG